MARGAQSMWPLVWSISLELQGTGHPGQVSPTQAFSAVLRKTENSLALHQLEFRLSQFSLKENNGSPEAREFGNTRGN